MNADSSGKNGKVAAPPKEAKQKAITPTRSRGRPSLLTQDREAVLMHCIKNGMSYRAACALARISYDTFNRWRKLGTQSDAPVEFRDFCGHIDAAEAEGEESLLNIIWKAARTKDWKAAAFILERRYPKEWGRKEKAPPLDKTTLFMEESKAITAYFQQELPIETTTKCLKAVFGDMPEYRIKEIHDQLNRK